LAEAADFLRENLYTQGLEMLGASVRMNADEKDTTLNESFRAVRTVD